MKMRVFPAALIVALAACSTAAPPASTPSPRASADADVPPVLGLLNERERLALEPAQVEALESIARDWEAANDTLTRRVGAVKGRGPSPLRLLVAGTARHALIAMAENNRRAAVQVGQVLKPTQRQALCTTQHLRREAAAVARQAKGVRADAATAGSKSRAWPWCAPDFRANEARSAS